MARVEEGRGILIIGLGRFGISLAETLMEQGHEVLGVDASARIVQQQSSHLTHVVEGDAANPDLLHQLGAGDFKYAVVAIGTNLEASILVTAALSDLGVPQIWAKALSDAHRRILERVGAHHVVQPEHDSGRRVGHLVTGRMLDYVVLDDDFALVETSAPSLVLDRSLAECGVRDRFEVTVMAVKPSGQRFTYATADTVVRRGDTLLVAGTLERVEAFADLE